MKIIEFPGANINDIPRGLRALADQIEAGKQGTVHTLVWIIDQGNGKTEVGVLGLAASPDAVAYYLLGLGQRKLEGF